MKIIEVDQGSPEWLAWRKTVITATECPAIRGSSPWSTAYKCWQRKLGLIEEQKNNEAMERGKRLEPIIRERFMINYDIHMMPVVVESSEYEFLGASLDGLSGCRRYILEIKTGGTKLHNMALDGKIPEYYMDQIQHQLLVTAADKCFYSVGSENENEDIVIEVFPDPQFAKSYIPQARAFWKCIAFSEPPELQDSDYVDMSDNLTWGEKSVAYQVICQQIKSLEEKKEDFRKQILTLCGDHNCSGAGLKVMKTITRGRVAYDDIPELKQVDLEKYRKQPTNSWRILVS